MKKINREKLTDLLAQLSQLAKEGKEDYISICISDGHITVNNKYWEEKKAKQLSLFSSDRGETWIDMLSDS